MMKNPFSIYRYREPEYFCDREMEISWLLEAFDNGRYTLLYSMRRLGKTGLVHHLHHMLSRRKKHLTIYCDMQNTHNDRDFVTKLIAASIYAIEKTQKGIVRRMGKFFSSLRPVVTFDPITQMPSVELIVSEDTQIRQSLDTLIEMLSDLDMQVHIAIDEFQQIDNYKNGSVIDATLRGYLQKIPNVQFLFAGSQRHLLLDLFSNVKRPFYNAVDQWQLQPLDPQIYASFIHKHFLEGGQDIDLETVSSVLTWTRIHTFHTQYFCNRLYSKGLSKISYRDIESLKKEILFSFEPNYLQLRAALSTNQWKMLSAIAKEGAVESVNGQAFLSRYHMAQSSATQATKVLLEKEILYAQRNRTANVIIVYDPFLANWIREVG